MPFMLINLKKKYKLTDKQFALEILAQSAVSELSNYIKSTS